MKQISAWRSSVVHASRVTELRIEHDREVDAAHVYFVEEFDAWGCYPNGESGPRLRRSASWVLSF